MADKIIETYDYRDETDTLLYQNVRYEPKTFRQRRPDGDGWIWNLNGTRRVLYRLQELLRADFKEWVFYCEGEQDVDRVRALGLTATTAGSAHSWKDEFAEFLSDRKVIILPDCDSAGKALAERISKALEKVGCPEFKVLNLPDLAKSEDISDWLNAGGTKEQLRKIVTATKTFDSDDGIEPVVVPLSTVKEEKVEWLWKERIPQGKITLLVGDPGLGKSFLSLYVAAKLTTGSAWPDMPDTNIPIGSVIILSAEDDIADTIIPRLNAAGANLNKIIAIQGVKHKDLKNKQYFDLTKHIPQLEKAIKTMLDVSLVIIDPLTAYLGTTDGHKNSEVRGCLAPLADMAARHKVAILGISHLNKNSAQRSVYRIQGNVAFAAAARAAWAVAKDKDDPARRIFCPIKTNLSVSPTSLAFRIIDGAVAVEQGIINMTAEEILTDDTDEKTTLRYAAEWLSETLASEPMLTRDVFKIGKDNEGLSVRTLQRAAQKLNVKSKRVGFGKEQKTTWELRK